MPIAHRVNDFIASIFPERVCDQCICAELKLRAPTQATPTAVALGTTRDFRREIGVCSICESTRMTTRATAQRAPLADQSA
jgi:hypothetical protein